MTAHFRDNPATFAAHLREGQRALAINVSLLSARGLDGGRHGLVVSAAAPLIMSSPTLIVAIDRTASVHTAIMGAGCYCLNQISRRDIEVLAHFSRSDRYADRFAAGSWMTGLHDLPYLGSAFVNYFCRVAGAHDYGDHTVFIGCIEGVRLNERLPAADNAPLIWMNGGPARVDRGEHA